MEVNFADTFFESFKRMIDREKWYWKTWDFIRYDLPRGLKNFWHFRKAVWNYRWWSGQHAVLPLMQAALKDMALNIESHGHEVESSSSKKIRAIKRAAELMQQFIDDDFIELAEEGLGEIIHHPWEFEPAETEGYVQIKDQDTEEEREHNGKIFARAREIEEQLWDELWHLMKGQDYSKFEETPEDMDHNESYDHWQNQVDGSGLRGWWD
jgi:hypothetical protein